jgi:hypothetical protein
MLASYRYLLSRKIADPSDRVLLVCMLNPSTADDTKNDPTILRVCRLAEQGGFGQLLVLNLLGIRATKPSDIWLHDDPLGVDNWQTWEQVLQDLVLGRDEIAVAWGRAPMNRSQRSRFDPILLEAADRLLSCPIPLMTWVKNLDGSPRHPLYIRTTQKLQPYDLGLSLGISNQGNAQNNE